MLENREVNSIIPSYVMKGNLVDSTTHAAMLDAMAERDKYTTTCLLPHIESIIMLLNITTDLVMWS